MATEQLGELFGRIHAGFRRHVAKGALLNDPDMRRLHDRLRGLKPRDLVRNAIQDTRFVVIDTETTGFKAYAGDEICAISLVELEGLDPTGRELNSLINPGREIPATSSRIHNIRAEDVVSAPVIEELFQDIGDFIGESVLIGHHVAFDLRFLNKTLQKELLCHLRHPCIDTMMLYLAASGRVGHYGLEEVAAFTKVPLTERHTARGDAIATARIFARLARHLATEEQTVRSLMSRQTELGQF